MTLGDWLALHGSCNSSMNDEIYPLRGGDDIVGGLGDDVIGGLGLCGGGTMGRGFR